jgi:hypothetical protein
MIIKKRVNVRFFLPVTVIFFCLLDGTGLAKQDNSIQWIHLTSMKGQVPVPNVGRQVATLILDIDNDGINDFVVASYEKIAWFQHTSEGWTRYAVENGAPGVRIEAGGGFYDIDGDGDLDILEGAQSKAGEIWWW